MLHVLKLHSLPTVSSLYHLERQTIWQTCDRENILIMMETGRCLFTLGGKSYAAEPGDLIFIPAGQDYKREPLDEAPATFTYFHFSLPDAPLEQSPSACARELIRQQAESYRSSDRQAQPAPAIYLYTQTHLPEEGLSLCRAALQENELNRTDSRLFYTLTMMQLLALASRETILRLMAHQAQLPDTLIPVKLREALLYIRKNHDRPLTVGEVCREAGISRQHMVRLFRAELNMTPIQYINHTKIMHAKDLIWRNRQLSVKELSYELGFADEHYFSRLFTRIAGETPSQFRERVFQYSDSASLPK